MTVRELLAALTIRNDDGEHDFEVLARDAHGAWRPVRLVCKGDHMPSKTLVLDSWEAA